MAFTKEQMFAIPTSRFALESQSATGMGMPNPTGYGDTPVMGGAAPPLPAASAAAMPAPPVEPLNPATQTPLLHPELRNFLEGHFRRQAADAQAQGEAARTFVGPGGPVGELYADSAERTRAAGDITQAAEEKQAAGLAEAHHTDAERIERDQRADEQRMRARETMVRDYQRRADVLAEQAQNAEVRDFWADKSTGSRIMGILAQTLSGAANGLAGNPGAPSALDKIIDRDLETQQKNMQNKRLAADHALNALGQVYKGFESQDASIAAYRQAAAQWVKSKSAELAAQFQGETAPARNQMVQATQDQTIAKSQTDIAQHASESADRRLGNSDRGLSELARDDANLDQVNTLHDSDMIQVPGISVPVRKSLYTSSWVKSMGAFTGALGQLDHIDKMVSKPGFHMADLAGSEAGSSLLTGDMRTILGTGANLSAKEEKDLNAVVVHYLKLKGANSIADLGVPDAKQLIGQIRLAISRTMQGRIRPMGIGADLRGDAGFESARAAIDADEAE